MDDDAYPLHHRLDLSMGLDGGMNLDTPFLPPLFLLESR